MAAPERPVLWEGTFECACGFRSGVKVLGRRGHRYDELEDGVEEGEEHIREDYSGEARSVMDLAPCPSCKRRRRAGRELGRQLLSLAVLLAMAGATALVLWRYDERRGAEGVGIAAAIVVAARAVVLAFSWLEAKERLAFTPR